MIKLKLKELAEKKNKTISDIARETKINRNTITSLYHNKVDGIKFSTLDKICQTYNVGIQDLIELDKKEIKKSLAVNVYKQEGEIIPFTGWPVLIAFNDLNKKFFNKNFGRHESYFLGDYGTLYYLDKNCMRELARDTYETHGKNLDKLNLFFDEYLLTAKKLIGVYQETEESSFLEKGIEYLKDFFEKLKEVYFDFWRISLFIDAFDEGFDQDEIERIAQKNKISKEDVSILLTPIEMTYNNERLLRLLELVKKLKTRKQRKNLVKDFVKKSDEVKKYIKEFDYYKSNYAFAKHITEKEVIQDIEKYLKDKKSFQEEYEKLKNYSKDQKKKISKVLKKYKLKSNPLFFFQKLTYWREHRKMANLMGIHLLFLVLQRIEKEVGINLKYLKYLGFDEFEGVLRGLIGEKELKNRYKNGMAIVVDDNNEYKVLLGKEASSLRDEREKELEGKDDEKIIPGHVASQGYARGIARIVMDQKDFEKFKEGEILVTGMTRPEFLPIMKKSIAIVTDEGGITCHAAIVSRELEKPCIIGTKNATKIIKDGDLIEVRANHGTVRILKRK